MLEQKETRIYTVKNKGQAKKALVRAAEVIREGGLVCFPTETVYGLGADANNDRAVADIFRAKNRSFENPVALHLHSVEEIPKYVSGINRRAEILMEKFLPGPLMLIFHKNDQVSDIVTGGLKKVGIRVPRHEICLQFLEECNAPVAATSANPSGRLSCVKAEDILEDMNGKFDVLLDVGNTPLGIESTVLDVTSDPPRIIRPGFITMEEIAIAIGVPPIISDNVVPKSSQEPVTGEKSRLVVLEGEHEKIVENIREYMELHRDKKVGIIVTDETFPSFKSALLCRKIGSRNDPAGIARGIFEILREMEKVPADIILMEGIPREGLGRTLMIRLCRMADEVIKLFEEEPEPPQPPISHEPIQQETALVEIAPLDIAPSELPMSKPPSMELEESEQESVFEEYEEDREDVPADNDEIIIDDDFDDSPVGNLSIEDLPVEDLFEDSVDDIETQVENKNEEG